MECQEGCVPGRQGREEPHSGELSGKAGPVTKFGGKGEVKWDRQVRGKLGVKGWMERGPEGVAVSGQGSRNSR